MNSNIIPIYRKEGDDYIFVGSGFFITDRLLATAMHVCHQGRLLNINDQIIRPKAVFEKYRTHLAPDADDLAILQLPHDVPSQPYWPLASTKPLDDTECSILGLNGSGGLHQQTLQKLTCLMGCKSCENPPNENSIHLSGWHTQLLGGKLAGMSGGPILNPANEVIGLLSRGQRIVGTSPSELNFSLTATSTPRILRALEETRLTQ